MNNISEKKNFSFVIIIFKFPRKFSNEIKKCT